MWNESRKIKIKVGKEMHDVDVPGKESVDRFAEPNVKFADDPERRVELVREVRKYQMITPLFGGGAEPKKADEISVVRATEIRGHLRFWWRAVRAGQFNGDLAEMKRNEDAIFGSTEQSSNFQISILTTKRGERFPDMNDHNGNPRPIDDIRSPLSYVAFPLRGEPDVRVIEKIEFEVTATFPLADSVEIRAAFWAWETFGGLGARTRRGFGSIQNINYRPNDHETVLRDVRAGLEEFGANGTWPMDVPHLSNSHAGWIKLTAPRQSAVECWKLIVDRYRKFRQSRAANNRSNWSEPDAIRRKFPGRHHPHHSTPMSHVDKFPRAQFGLPIIFQFKRDDVRAGDPEATTLEGRSKDQKRLGSPLCFRVMQCASGQYVGLVFLLGGTQLPTSGVILSGAHHNPIVQTDLTPSEAASVGLNTMLAGNQNVLEAFLATI